MALLGGDEKGKLGSKLRSLMVGGLDLLFPPLCLQCRIEVDGHDSFCSGCWAKLSFLAGSQCYQCGFPFESDLGPDTLCAACIAAPPAYDRARAVFRYDDNSRRLVLSFKHGDRLEGAPAFARWMARVIEQDLLGASGEEIDLIAPVPLHRWRLLKRRYNQAAVLALGLGREMARPVLPELLRRVRATPSQGGLNREERRKNVRGAFALRPHLAERVADRSLLLVDDVMTTGATLDACAKTLKQAGARAVYVVALGRAVQDRA
ncbi:ComF family protein [Govanella unica]|uniref:ComF family protein n=1 Tax=Govanella unica TaxID=2975056 RepID=A0A9X3TV53_9PROT|nr:ComF family protein [Govania unica]MDA5192356.1 ComF family protein [Govania unica]